MDYFDNILYNVSGISPKFVTSREFPLPQSRRTGPIIHMHVVAIGANECVIDDGQL